MFAYRELVDADASDGSRMRGSQLSDERPRVRVPEDAGAVARARDQQMVGARGRHRSDAVEVAVEARSQSQALAAATTARLCARAAAATQLPDADARACARAHDRLRVRRTAAQDGTFEHEN